MAWPSNFDSHSSLHINWFQDLRKDNVIKIIGFTQIDCVYSVIAMTGATWTITAKPPCSNGIKDSQLLKLFEPTNQFLAQYSVST